MIVILLPDYSSICCFVGTNRGNFATFKILPSGNGTYTVSFAGATNLDDKVIRICPIDADTGNPALATQTAVASLRNGFKLNGVVIAVTPSSCRIFKPAASKGAHKTWDDFMCDSAAVVKTEGRGYSLVGLFGDGNARAYSIPGLREIGCAQINHILDIRRLSEALISPTGDVLGWIGPSEIGVFNVWGSGITLYVVSTDLLLTTKLTIPPGSLPVTDSSTIRHSFLLGQPFRTSSGSLALNTFLLLIWTFLVSLPIPLLFLSSFRFLPFNVCKV